MIEERIQQAISQGLKELYDIDAAPTSVALQGTRKEFEGDFTVVVFPWVKQARKAPQQVAEELGKRVEELLPEVESSNAVKGFLNFVIGDDYWHGLLKDVLATDAYGIKEAAPQEAPIVIEYSSPNTNKPLHLGHIRNNLLGWSVAQLLKANGNNVKMVNLVNDRGIHIMKSMLAWKLYGDGKTPESSGMKGDHLVGKYYVEFDKHYKKEVEALVAKGMDEEQAKKEAPLIVEAQHMLKRWEDGDKEMRDLWNLMNGWVYKGFDETYERLGVGFDKIYYESNTYLLGKEQVQKGLEMGELYKKEDGSVWCDLTDAGLDHKLLLRKDGTSVYMTQDLGTALLRHEDFGSDRLVYVVGNEQDYHFQVLKIVLKRLGHKWAENIYHLSYGMVELPNGKMKSREGTVVDADDLIAEMEAQAKEMCQEKGKSDDLCESDLNALYHTIALGALKYFILKVDPTRNMLFNPAESIDFNGNTGPFIQYTYARINSIVRKGANAATSSSAAASNKAIGPKEKEVLRLIHELPATIEQAAMAYSPAQIANYAYSVAKAFNSFYQDTPILKCEDEGLRHFRVSLCSAVAQVLKNTMQILGIEVPERM